MPILSIVFLQYVRHPMLYFSLVFPSRTFYLVAKCNDEKDSWIGFFQSRIVSYLNIVFIPARSVDCLLRCLRGSHFQLFEQGSVTLAILERVEKTCSLYSYNVGVNTPNKKHCVARLYYAIQ